jgi:F0F1-type ATP synthase membrane subunit b/b'
MMAVSIISLWAWAEPTRPAASAAEPGRTVAPPPNDRHESMQAGRPVAVHDEGPGPINWTQFGGESPPFIAMLINFGILIAGYYLLGKKPITSALEQRRSTISREIDEAQRMKREAEGRAKTYQAKLATLDDDARIAHEALVRAGEAERDRIVKEAVAKAERMQKDAEFLVAQEIKQIRQDLWRDAVEAAVLAAEELLTKRVTPSDQERLADDYLSELEWPAAPAPGGTAP